MEAMFPLREDIGLVQDLLGISAVSLADDLGVSRMTLNRWGKDPRQASPAKLEAFYGYAYQRGIRLNDIHAQLFQEETRARGLVPLFHGSKAGVQGALSLSLSRADNDFGCGFYCGESLQQAASFVARFPRPVCYFAALDVRGLESKTFGVCSEWMIAVALFRGKLRQFESHAAVARIRAEVERADYMVAPIADNRMFDIIESFTAGEITDAQCEHSLSATSLGNQYVLRTQVALESVVKLQPHFICEAEKAANLAMQRERARVGADKVKAAKRQYRAQGSYIEELLS